MGLLAEAIARFHDSADRLLNAKQSVAPLNGILRDNDEAFAANLDVIPKDAALELPRLSRERIAALTPLLRSRGLGGYVRHCHGDLHLRNIVEIDGKPVLFDAIEFDDSLATIDVLYDLAFLLMDLGKRDLTAHANAVLNAYLDHEGSTANLIGLAALPLFLATRAAIRAKVELLRAKTGATGKAAATRKEARSYFDSPAPSLRRSFSISSASADCRALANRRLAARLRRISAHFLARFISGATSNENASLGSLRPRNSPKSPTRRKSPTRSMPYVASAPSWPSPGVRR